MGSCSFLHVSADACLFQGRTNYSLPACSLPTNTFSTDLSIERAARLHCCTSINSECDSASNKPIPNSHLPFQLQNMVYLECQCEGMATFTQDLEFRMWAAAMLLLTVLAVSPLADSRGAQQCHVRDCKHCRGLQPYRPGNCSRYPSEQTSYGSGSSCVL